MRFFQDNLFFVVLGLVTVVVCGGLMGIAMHFDGVFEKQLQERKSLAGKIAARERQDGVNNDIINSHKQYIEGVKEDVKDARIQNVAWTSDNFSIPMLELLGSQKQDFTLPFKKEVWGVNQFYNKFVGFYTRRVQDMITPDGNLKFLKVTMPPKAEEIENRRDELLEKILRRLKMQITATDKGRTKTPPKSGEKQMTPEEEAMSDAQRELSLIKAKAGVVYADYGSMGPLFARDEVVTQQDLPPVKIWRAHLDMWIKEEVVKALKDTIDQVMAERGIKGPDRNVIVSPIKRIFRIGVDSLSEAELKAAERAPDRGIDFDSPEDVGGPGGRRTRVRPGRGRGRGRGGEEEYPDEYGMPGGLPKTLTQDVSNKVFDVVEYSFSVLMPTRYLPKLQENLIKRNYHIITNVEITKPFMAAGDLDAPTGRRGGTPVMLGEGSDLFYYGTEPLRRVTISAQMRMMAAWTRGEGECNKEKRQIKWIRPAVMPAEALKLLPVSALRDIDKYRLAWKQ
jgi:hypothetical protein